MIYLAIFYFSCNFGIILADINYTEDKHYDFVDMVLCFFIGLPFTVWLLTQD